MSLNGYIKSMELKHNFKLILPTGYQNKNNKNLRRCISLHLYCINPVGFFKNGGGISMAKVKIRADVIKYALSKRHSDELFLTEVKTGPSTMSETLRFDALSIKLSWTKPCFTGYEVKVSRNDFLHDDKFIHYRKYCHRLYIVCPKEMIKPEEVPEDIGLMYYNPDRETLFIKRTARIHVIEIPGDLLYYILMSRLDREKHPFFSSQREHILAYLEDKETRDGLSSQFKSKMAKDVDDAKEKVKSLTYELEAYKEKADERDNIVKLLRDKGLIGNWSYDLVEDIKDALIKPFPSELYTAVSKIKNSVEILDKMLSTKKEGQV